MTFDQYGRQTVGGPQDIPAECRAKDDTGSADDMWLRTKATARAIPEENTGFEDHRPLSGAADAGDG